MITPIIGRVTQSTRELFILFIVAEWLYYRCKLRLCNWKRAKVSNPIPSQGMNLESDHLNPQLFFFLSFSILSNYYTLFNLLNQVNILLPVFS